MSVHMREDIIRLNKQNKPIGETAKPLGVAKSTGGMYWLT